MATGIAQKTCTALFPLWPVRKNDISKNKKYIWRENKESIERNFKYLNVEKNKNKKYTYPVCSDSKVHSLSVTIAIHFSFT